MLFRATQCCAISEITSLSTHTTGEEAMLSFCTQQFVSDVRHTWGIGRGVDGKPDALYSFYLFTAACRGKIAGSHYGKDFADFIKANKLGTVWESPALVNVAFHPDHANQVYIFMPDATACREWYDAHLAKERAEAKAKHKKIVLNAGLQEAIKPKQKPVVRKLGADPYGQINLNPVEYVEPK